MDGFIENTDINFYTDHVYLHLRDQVETDIIDEIKMRGMKQRSWVYGQPVANPVAGRFDEYIHNFYKSKFMYNLATSLLGKEDIWLFNDQIVIKKPNDNFVFPEHTDNDVVDVNKDYKIETVNISVILDDFTNENGTLEILSQLTKNWITTYPKKGDIVAIRGNTLHRSGENKSSESRGLLACVYTEEKLNVDMFYTEKFIL